MAAKLANDSQVHVYVIAKTRGEDLSLLSTVF